MSDDLSVSKVGQKPQYEGPPKPFNPKSEKALLSIFEGIKENSASVNPKLAVESAMMAESYFTMLDMDRDGKLAEYEAGNIEGLDKYLNKNKQTTNYYKETEKFNNLGKANESTVPPPSEKSEEQLEKEMKLYAKIMTQVESKMYNPDLTVETAQKTLETFEELDVNEDGTISRHEARNSDAKKDIGFGFQRAVPLQFATNYYYRQYYTGDK